MIRQALVVAVLVSFPVATFAQRPNDSIAGGADSITVNLRAKAPAWLKDFPAQPTKFTFVRVQYDSVGPRAGNWATDFPDAELNLTAQLGRLTKLEIAKPRAMRVTEPAIGDYPILYLAEPGRLRFSDAEIAALRKYLDAGGFLIMDDFWGEAESQNVFAVMKQVLPKQNPVELKLDHPLFHCVFDLKEKPQVLSIHAFIAGQKTERFDAVDVHYHAIQDERGRIMVLICQNTDLADGWERFDVDPEYAREMSIAKAYPMGINMIYFALTQPKKSK
jgi:hypothetical protein